MTRVTDGDIDEMVSAREASKAVRGSIWAPENQERYRREDALPRSSLWPEFVRKALPISYGALAFWRYIVNVNDAPSSDAWREHYIQRAFAATDHEVEFVGGSTPSESKAEP